jgi:hypothetical protein
MKKVSLLLFLLIAYCVSFAQYPVIQNLGAPKTLVTSKGGFSADSALILPAFADTNAANLSPYVKYYAGNMIRVGNQVYVRNATATAWLTLATSGTAVGSVQSIFQGYGITNSPNPITVTGNIKVDTTASTGLSGKYLRIVDTTNKFVNNITRTAGKDSIIFFKGPSRYAIKDSIGVPPTRTISTTAPLVGGGDLSANRTLSMPAATTSVDGYLTSTNFNTFNNKENALTFFAPLFRSTNSVSITLASSTNNGYLSATNFNTFSNKVDTIYRTTGKDSIQFYINGRYHAIKDSTGGGGSSVSISQGYGITNTPNPITSTGTIQTDTTRATGLSNKYVRFTDTSAMLNPYLRKVDTASLSNRINLKLNISDTNAMLSPYLRKIDTTNKFVNTITRTAGKDSIIFFIGGNRYAIKDSSGGGGTVTTAVDTMYRTIGKDSIQFTIGGRYHAIKDSVGGGGGGTPAGSNGYVQFNNSGSFGADSSLFWNNTNKRLGIGTTQPQNKLDVISGNVSGGMNRGSYETSSFTNNGDNKLGIYNAGNFTSGGSSITFGSIKNKNSAGYYPGFEFQNSNDSANPQNSFMRYNYIQRNDLGQVENATIDLMNINANGKVQINGSDFYSGINVNPRLVIGSDDQGANLEVSGNAFIGSGLTSGSDATINGGLYTNGARVKHINSFQDDGNADYYVQSNDHILIIYFSNNNVNIHLPENPPDGREIIIKAWGDVGDYYTSIYASGDNDIVVGNTYYDSTQPVDILHDTEPNSMTLIYSNQGDGVWFILQGQIQ